MKLIFILAITLLILTQVESNTSIYLPISEQLLYKINLSIKRLEALLGQLGTTQDVKQKIWHRTQLTKRYLHQVRRQLQNYNSVSIGQNNNVQGSQNIVFGNKNNLQGHQNWVFTSDYAGKVNGSLLLAQWKIQLNMTQYIVTNPGMAITFLNDQKNRQLVQKLFSKNRQFVQWGEWAQPSQYTKQVWGNYAGFNQWTSTFERKLLNWILQKWESVQPSIPNIPRQSMQSSQISQMNSQNVGSNLRIENQQQSQPYYPFFNLNPIVSPGTNWILMPNPFSRF